MTQLPTYPMDDPAWGKVAAEFVAANAEKFASTIQSIGRRVTVAAKTRLSGTYKSYLDRVVAKYGTGKTFFIRDKLTPFYQYYVPLAARCARKEVDLVDAESMEGFGRNLIIDGSGGCGKSTLMRHLALNEIVRKKKVPVLVELRVLNERKLTQHLLWNTIVETITGLDHRLDPELIAASFKAGLFTVLLDGYDEVTESKRQGLSRQIRAIADQYTSCNIWIASRPDPIFVGWDDFSIVSTLPLDEARACALIAKLPADSELKEKFIRDLRGSLFKQHKSFLSNPLLLTIMLLTYSQTAEIPKRLSVFYEQAYCALFQGHDALKGGFRRDRRTQLDVQDFSRVFAAFAIQSYDDNVTHMAESNAMRYLLNAMKLTHVTVSADNFLADALQSICLLIKDGVEIRFAHRSFQEYFAAQFIASQPREVRAKLVDKYANRFVRDATLRLLYELQPETVENGLFLPYLDELYDSCGVKRKVGFIHWLRFMREFFQSVNLHPTNPLTAILLNSSWDGPGPFIHHFIIKTQNGRSDWPVSKAKLKLLHSIARGMSSASERPDGTIEIPFDKLSYRDDLTKALFQHGGAFSGEYLSELFRVRKLLRDKSERRILTVNEILNI